MSRIAMEARDRQGKVGVGQDLRGWKMPGKEMEASNWKRWQSLGSSGS